MNHCLVTGVTGFIGRELCRHLRVKKNIVIKAVTRQKIEGNWDQTCLCDFEQGVIPGEEMDGVDTIFHLAGLAHDFRTGLDIDSVYRKVNTEATVNLASLAAERGVKRFVFVSSVKAGGSAPEGECADEDSQGEPEGIYGLTKRNAELGLLQIGKETGMHVSIIRPALVYGPNVKGNLQMMLNGIIKGWFPPLPETLNVRTMVHVEDLVNALILVAEKKEANGEIFILTDGKHYSSRGIFNEMCVAVGNRIPRWYVPKIFFFISAKVGDLMGSFAKVPFDSLRYHKLLGDDCYSSNKIREKLGFQSKFTLINALPEMVRKMRE
ncbi:MAG: NAD-dependent epimerase/dehydratase family protein [Desulfobacteraceae bacterium]|nr:NAD-dependent epimerase/dehydratase family protein [Desulfobacteraceae bacterium]